jgi:hypothetical protein
MVWEHDRFGEGVVPKKIAEVIGKKNDSLVK